MSIWLGLRDYLSLKMSWNAKFKVKHTVSWIFVVLLSAVLTCWDGPDAKVWRAAQKIFTWISSAQRCFSTKFVEFCVWIVLQRVGHNFSGILGFQITPLLLLISEYFRCIFWQNFSRWSLAVSYPSHAVNNFRFASCEVSSFKIPRFTQKFHFHLSAIIHDVHSRVKLLVTFL